MKVYAKMGLTHLAQTKKHSKKNELNKRFNSKKSAVSHLLIVKR